MKTLFLIIFSVMLCGCQEKSVIIYPDNEKIQYTGRIDFSNPEAPVLFWPGTSVKAAFHGTALKIHLDDQRGENFFNAIIDDDYDQPVIIDLSQGDSVYSIVENLSDKGHTVELFKRTEGHEGYTKFKGFEIEDCSGLGELPPKPHLKLEFYGNSITSGMGIEDYSRDKNDEKRFKNNFMAYGAVTARNLNAQYHCISLSGIGITVSWFDRIMPEVYNRLDPSNSESRWDFSKYRPQIVIINLFQNDSWLVHKPEHNEFIRRFPDGIPPEPEELIRAYVQFVSSIRSEYPAAHIICSLGSMDATKEGKPWADYIKKAVAQLKAEKKDQKLYTLFFPYKETEAHPTVDEEAVMAKKLTRFIRTNILPQLSF
jgi:hypothetical protein